MVPVHFHDAAGDLSDHNVGKIFGLSKILTVLCSYFDRYYSQFVFVFRAGLFSSSDTFTGCSAVVVKGLNMSKTCQTPQSSRSSAEVSEYVLRLKYEFFGAEHMTECFKCGPALFHQILSSVTS